ncbi:MAG: LysR family transcriptional regulator [Rhodobacteraceae bacterium]|nr:LysR family transcriptional regulator [Paracoccaceae bacterium]
MDRVNWDDLRFVLAVAEEGSVNAASRRLGVNHATVLRRVAAYEDATGVPLFDRTARGYVVPGERREIIEAAREVERAVLAVARRLRGAQAPLSGDVRITSTDSLCVTFLPVVLERMRQQAPGLTIELMCSNAHLDLGRTHADITVRPADRLPEDLVGDTAAIMAFGVFRKAGTGEARWLGLAGPLERSRVARWLAEAVDPKAIALRADSFLVLRELAAAGHGLAVLPAFLGAEDARLEPVAGLMPHIEVPVWVASHSDLADVPRIAATRAALLRALGDEAARLAPPLG